MAGKGILLDTDGDLLVSNGSLKTGESTMQEVAIILQMNQGEQKFMPVLGANIIQLAKSKVSRFDMESRTKIALALDGKDYDQLKEQVLTYAM